MIFADTPRHSATSDQPRSVSLLVADDHALLRQGLIELLHGVYDDWTFHQAATLDETTDILDANDITMLILDLKMPGMNSVATIEQIRSRYPTVSVTILTGSDDRATILQCLKAGVHGYVLKSGASNQLVQAIETVLAGGIYVPPVLSHVANIETSHPSMLDIPAMSPSLPMTGRQVEVLKLLAEGRSTKDIARVLGLGIGTVKVHLAGVYRALGAHSRMEAVVKAGKFRN